MTTFRTVREAIVAQVGPHLKARAQRNALLRAAVGWAEVVHDDGTSEIVPTSAYLPLVKEAREKPDPETDAILASLDLSGFAMLVDPTAEVLESIALHGARQGVLSVKALAPAAEDFALPNDVVRTWAQDHAASLVGKRVLEDGTVIDNPRAEYAISEATRTLVRGTINEAFQGDGLSRDELAAKLTDAYAFSEDRAQQIARTEIGFALEAGNRAAWQASGVVDGIEIILGDTHPEPDECDDIANGTVYPIDAAPIVPIHPGCICASLPVVSEAP